MCECGVMEESVVVLQLEITFTPVFETNDILNTCTWIYTIIKNYHWFINIIILIVKCSLNSTKIKWNQA